MQPQLQRLEVEPTVLLDDDLAVDDASRRECLLCGLDDVREVARQRPFVARPKLDLVTVAKDDAAKAIPLRFVEHPTRHVVRLWHLLDRFREHRLDRRHDRQLHTDNAMG